ncbi:leucine rich repeat domain-containing protein [Ditylenchus destructor]|nr:leucine rich repeat domain-containing protein [Ditylenchus destructor]
MCSLSTLFILLYLGLADSTDSFIPIVANVTLYNPLAPPNLEDARAIPFSISKHTQQRSRPLNCPRQCACSQNTVICTGQQLKEVPKQIPPDTIRLDLQENKIPEIRRTDFAGLRQLKILQLMDNEINTIEAGAFDDLINLERIRLSRNRLRSIPEHIFRNNVKLHRLDLSENYLTTMTDEQLSGPKQMKCSGIEKRAASSCREASICPPLCACTETTVDCHDRGLKQIPLNLPSTTTELRLEGNRIAFIPNHAFRNLRNLVRLDLSKNVIQDITEDAFFGLSSLNTLMLFANNLTELPPQLFRPLISLQLLLLNTNKLQCLRKEVFKGLNKLNLLSLYDNQIKSIQNGTFSDLHSLQTLHLARNPLICDCNLEWLAELLSEKPMETSGARCHLPKRLSKRRLGSIPPNKFRCKEMLGSSVNSLKILLLGGNVLQCATSLTFGQVYGLRTLDLSANNIRSVTDGTFSNIQLGGNQFACNCHLVDFVRFIKKSGNTKIIEAGKCFEPQHLKERSLISLSDEELVCTGDRENVCEENGNYCPSGCSCAKTIVRCTGRQLTEFPLGIPSDTTELYLDNNLISSLPKDQLQNLSNLIKLDLSQNRIDAVENGTFLHNSFFYYYNILLRCLEETSLQGLFSLRILSLHGNQLSQLPESAFTDLVNLTHIALGSNPLYCDCKIAWFSKVDIKILHIC